MTAFLVCDDCGRVVTLDGSRDEVREMASMQGWAVGAMGDPQSEDFCDECLQPREATAVNNAGHVARGGCPYLNGKVFCNGDAGHSGGHWARQLNPDGSTRTFHFDEPTLLP